MSITTERFQGPLTVAAQEVLSAGTSDVLTISKALVTNQSTTTAYTYTVHDDVDGSGVAADNMVLNAVTVSPKETRVLPLSALAALNGGKVWALASVDNQLNISLTYSRTAQ